VLLWVELWLAVSGRGHRAVRARNFFLAVNLLVYVVQVVFWVVTLLKSGDQPMAQEVIDFFFAGVSLCCAVLFLLFGVLLLSHLSASGDAASRGTRSEVLWITVLCGLCFLGRCAGLLYRALDQDISVDFRFWLAFYPGTEIVPLAITLFVLRKMPQKATASSQELLLTVQ
jgi:hypothetical protein